jgi:hypothetical protein
MIIREHNLSEKTLFKVDLNTFGDDNWNVNKSYNFLNEHSSNGFFSWILSVDQATNATLRSCRILAILFQNLTYESKNAICEN